MNNQNRCTFTALSPDNRLQEYRALFTVTIEEIDTCYIVYTDGSLTDEGELRVFASIYELDMEGGFLLAIENDWEWDLLEDILKQYTEGM